MPLLRAYFLLRLCDEHILFESHVKFETLIRLLHPFKYFRIIFYTCRQPISSPDTEQTSVRKKLIHYVQFKNFVHNTCFFIVRISTIFVPSQTILDKRFSQHVFFKISIVIYITTVLRSRVIFFDVLLPRILSFYTWILSGNLVISNK